MVVFTPNIPQPGDFPSESQPLLLANAQYLAGTASKGLLKDHDMTLDTSNATDGMHKQITFNSNQATPGFVGGVSVLYTNTANGQSQMFFNNNAAVNVQVTGFKPAAGLDLAVPTSAAAAGVTSLPGGLLLQWGFTALISNGTVITFPVAFSGAGYNVQISARGVAPGGSIFVTNIAAADWTFGISVGSAQIYWTAIGPA